MDSELVDLYVEETGIDRDVIALYIAKEVDPPSRDAWLSRGVPPKDRKLVFGWV
jgi:hypothetical protein